MRSADLGAAAGIGAAIVTLGGVLAATVVSPSFSWTRDALSDLGVTPGVAVLFNGSLVAGGALALPFAWHLRASASDRLRRWAATVLAASFVLMAGVGAVPAGRPLHLPLAVGSFGAFTVAFLLDGAGALRAGQRRWGVASVGLAAGHVAAWVVWGVAGPAAGVTGLALPETAGALALAGWTVATALGWKR